MAEQLANLKSILSAYQEHSLRISVEIIFFDWIKQPAEQPSSVPTRNPYQRTRHILIGWAYVFLDT